MHARIRTGFFILLIFLVRPLFAQTYITNGTAVKNSCNCYTLTQDVMNQSGSVWNTTKLDLQQPFDFKFNVFLGCSDGGADGIAFILQTSPSSIGRSGSGLGFADVRPSVAIALDTYQNVAFGSAIDDLNDPYYDHISIQANGAVRHGSDLAEPVPASSISDNIEDCQWHVLRITWQPQTKQLDAYFDGAYRVGATVDLVNTIFGSTAPVYWGFSAATGGAVNVQQFCTALNPDFKTNTANDGVCLGAPIEFTDQSLSFTNIAEYYWTFGDGTSSTTGTPPAHQYTAAGTYPVRLAITGLDGCKSDTFQKTITIASLPAAGFTLTDVCLKEQPTFSFTHANFGSSYQWLVDGAPFSTDEIPTLSNLSAGSYTLQRNVISDYGCGADEAKQPLLIKPIPVISTPAEKAVCINVPVSFTATQQDNNTHVQQWHWLFGDGLQALTQNPDHTFKRTGPLNVRLWAEATNGCRSDTALSAVTVHEALADAGVDTIVLNSVPFQLRGTGNGTARWLPANGLSQVDIFNPTGQLTDDQQYELTVTTTEGCIARDSVKIEVYKGSAVYVPTAFTPDGNGRNDLLKPMYVGMKRLHYFAIYNRWGQEVFKTTDLQKGWDGTQMGKAVATGTFVWRLQAEDILGHVYTLKGTFVLIR